MSRKTDTSSLPRCGVEDIPLSTWAAIIPLMLGACEGSGSGKETKAAQTENSQIQTATANRGPADWLILKFPDGVRGGRGRIQGLAEWQQSADHSAEALLRQVRGCGAINPQLNRGWSHALYIVSRRSPRDLDVVRCLQRKTYRHFTAGLGSDDPMELSRMDHTPFSSLSNAAVEPLNKVP